MPGQRHLCRRRPALRPAPFHQDQCRPDQRTRLEKLAVDPAATPAQQTKAQKETATVIKQIAELTEWEREVVYPMAQQKIAIDLDNGVKRNYPLFAGALKPIKGLEAADD